jgi:hypothetical protein
MYILGVIKKIVGKIDDTEYLEKLFDDLSDLHRRLGVEASGMDIFGKVFCKVGAMKTYMSFQNSFFMQVMRPILLEKKKWKPEIKDSWMTFFSSIVKVMKKSETKAEQNQGELEDDSNNPKHQVFRRNTFDRHLIEVRSTNNNLYLTNCQVGCDTFSQLFLHYPVLDYIAEYDSCIVQGVSIGAALRWTETVSSAAA